MSLPPEAASSLESRLQAVDSLAVDVIADNVSDAYVSKTLFAVSEFSNKKPLSIAIPKGKRRAKFADCHEDNVLNSSARSL